jgi:DNA-binding IclR family transcriptional regulator
MKRVRSVERQPAAIAPKRARAAASAPKAALPPIGKERGRIQSLERAFAILEHISRHRDGIALADLCKSVGLHSSTTFHLVKTMVQLGYATQHAESKRYKIGRKAFSLAAAALDERELVTRATPVLELLSSHSGESSHFAIRAANEVIVVAKTEGAGMFQLVDRAGVVRPANATALGKVLLAALTPAELDRYFATTELRRFTPKTIVDRERLVAELDQVRHNAMAFDDGEFDSEVRCVAVPVYDFLGRVAGAIGISGPMWRLSLQSLQEKARHVRQSASQLSAELGYREPSDAKVA